MNAYPLAFHVYSPDLSERLANALVYAAFDAEDAAEQYARAFDDRCGGTRDYHWPLTVIVHCPEVRSTVTAVVDRTMRASFAARIMAEIQ